VSSGATHNGITTAATVLVVGTELVLGAPQDVVLGTLAGGMAGWILTPDLDVDAGNRSDTILRAIFPPLEWIWDLFWYPYRVIVPHRSVWSHGFLVGTLTRLLYPLLAPITAVLVYYLPWQMSAAAFCMLCLADLLHLLADNVSTNLKRMG